MVHIKRLSLLAILSARSVVSKDPTRYHLNDIRVTTLDSGPTLTIEATDGHILVTYLVTDDTLAELVRTHYGSDLRLTPENVKLLVTLCKNKDLYIGYPTELIKNENASWRYPSFAQFVPKQRATNDMLAPITFGLDAELIGRLNDCFSGLRGSKRHNGIKFEAPKDNLSPFRVTPSGGLVDGVSEVLGVIMPMRV